MNRPMSEADKAIVRYRYLTDPNASVATLAEEFGVSRSAMLRALSGVTRRPGGIVKSRLSTEQMRKMRFEQGLTLYEIGRQAGLTESGVWRRLHPEKEAV